MCFLCLCGLGVSHGLASKERFQVAYVWMTLSGDGHRVRGVQVQDEKPKDYILEACGLSHDGQVKINTKQSFPHCVWGAT